MIRIEWLKENFPEDLVIFDIGVAGMESEIKQFRRNLPESKIYAFECSDVWLQENLQKSIEYTVHYFHCGVYNHDGFRKFTPSVSENGNHHPFSGTFFIDCDEHSKKEYGQPVEVPVVRLDTFCKKFKVQPDFIHIDVEGSEYYVLSAMGEYKPKAIWVELVGFFTYTCGVTIEKFNELMDRLGYECLGRTKNDGLYCLKDFKHTEYDFTNHEL